MLEFGTATSADVIGSKVTKEELIHFVIQCGGGRKKVMVCLHYFYTIVFSIDFCFENQFIYGRFKRPARAAKSLRYNIY